VRIPHGIGDLDCVMECFASFQTVVRDDAVQRFAGDVLHNKVIDVVFGPEIVYRDDIGVV
jgi:hypothetical protein